MRALINGQEVDVSPEELPAFSFSVEDTLEIFKVRGARSTTMSLPMTNRNRRIIGGSGMGERAPMSLPFSVRSGSASYFEGRCFIRERSALEASVVAVGDNADWMSALKGRKLRDIPLGFITSQNALYNIVEDSWDGSKRYVFPLIEYGAFEGRAINYNVRSNDLHPCLFLKDVIGMALTEVNYGISAGGSFKRTWERLIVPPVNGSVYSRAVVDPDNPAAASAVVDAGPFIYQPNIVGAVPNIYRYGTATDGLLSAIGTLGTYTAPAGGFSGDVRARLMYGEAFNPAFDGIQFVAVLWNQTTGQAIATQLLPNVDSSGAAIKAVNFDGVGIQEGHVAYIGIQTYQPVPSFPVAASMDVIWGRVRNYQDFASGSDEIDLSAILPDRGVLSLLADVCALYCILPVTRGNLVELWHYDELLGSFPQSDNIDLTNRQSGIPSKVTDAIPSAVAFSMDGDRDDRALDLIASEGLDVRKEFDNGESSDQDVKVEFAPTAMDTVMGLRMPAMRERDAEATGGFYPENLKRTSRLLLWDGLQSGSWTLDSSPRTSYPMAFSYGDGSISEGSTMFMNRPRQRGTVDKHWLSRLARWTSPRLVVDANWHDHEIASLDFSRQVKASDGLTPGLYYVLEINQHRFGMGEPSRTTLVPL